MDSVIHQLCSAFVEHLVYQARCLVPLLVFVLSYGPKHEGFSHEREREREREKREERGGGGRGRECVCVCVCESEFVCVHVYNYYNHANVHIPLTVFTATSWGSPPLVRCAL